jgi:hypothetical protein
MTQYLGCQHKISLTGRIFAYVILPHRPNRGGNKRGSSKMFDQAKTAIKSITELGIALLALAIVASLLVGSGNMAFLGDVTGNIVALVQQLGSAGLSGLIALGVVLWLFQK